MRRSRIATIVCVILAITPCTAFLIYSSPCAFSARQILPSPPALTPHIKHVSNINFRTYTTHVGVVSGECTLQASGDNEDCVARSKLVGSGMRDLAAMIAAVGVIGASATNAWANDEEPAITTKCYIEVRIMEPLNEANGYSSKNAYRGKLVFGLYGKACPKAVGNFLRYATADRGKDEPSYASGTMTKMEPGIFLEGGRIPGLNTISIGGQEELEFDGDVIASPSLLEDTLELRHSKKGLLTRDRLARGSEFGITLGPASELDGSHEVFGTLVQGEDVLERLEKIPVYGSNRLEPGSLMDKAFRAQNRALVNLGKNVFKDERAVDRTGLLLRRVDIVSCGLF